MIVDVFLSTSCFEKTFYFVCCLRFDELFRSHEIDVFLIHFSSKWFFFKIYMFVLWNLNEREVQFFFFFEQIKMEYIAQRRINSPSRRCAKMVNHPKSVTKTRHLWKECHHQNKQKTITWHPYKLEDVFTSHENQKLKE